MVRIFSGTFSEPDLNLTNHISGYTMRHSAYICIPAATSTVMAMMISFIKTVKSGMKNSAEESVFTPSMKNMRILMIIFNAKT